METEQLEALKQQANDLRIDIVRMIAQAGSGHPGGSLSCADILTALYFGGILRYDAANPRMPRRDRFILAKGHAAPALYAALAHAGFFPREELATLRKFGSRLQGHPDSNLLPGVEVSTGSLGQGLSIACGMACGLRLDGSDGRVFTLLGDGECQEGQVWEAAMFAAHNKLGNLVAIIDRNCLQIDGTTAEVCDVGDLAQKFAAFGWKTYEVDGHDMQALIEVFEQMRSCAAGSGAPQVVIAHTTKGKGVSFMENDAGWHGKAPNAEELARALADLGAGAAEAFWSASPSLDPTMLFAADGEAAKRHATSTTSTTSAQGAPDEQPQPAPLLPAEKAAAQPKRATRAAYGTTLAQLAQSGMPVVAVDGDLTASTTLKAFAAADPAYESRLFNAGIAEQNMTDIAAGLSLTDKVAFTGSFAVFGTGRAYDQIRNTVCYSNLNVKIAPTHAGISVGPDGGSHQMVEDISLMRGLPHMRVLVPADYSSTAAALSLAAHTPGPIYVRMGREPVPCIYQDDVQLRLGGSFVLRAGSDVTIIACGVELDQALSAADMLASHNISAEVIDAYSIKPLDVDTIAASLAKTGCAVTAEEHSIVGGLGAAISDVVCRRMQAPVPLEMVGVYDTFGKSGAFSELAAYFKLDAAAIVEAVKSVLARKQSAKIGTSQ